jgi:DNA-binding transcriptional LysR family regulator
MGKAAQRLNRTQPNISRSIAELEHALGVRRLQSFAGGKLRFHDRRSAHSMLSAHHISSRRH